MSPTRKAIGIVSANKQYLIIATCLISVILMSCNSKKTFTKEDFIGKKFQLDNISTLQNPDKQFPKEIMEKMGVEFYADSAILRGMMLTQGAWQIEGDTLQIKDKRLIISRFDGNELVLLKPKKDKVARFAFSLKQ